MIRTVVTENERDRAYRNAEISMNGKQIFLTPNMSMLIKSTRPNEFDLYYYTKTKFTAEHAETYVMRLYDAPMFLGPHRDKVKESTDQRDLKNDKAIHPYTRFTNAHVGLPDTGLEYLYFENKTQLKRLQEFTKQDVALTPLSDYIDSFISNRDKIDDSAQFNHVKVGLHRDFWLDNLGSRQETKTREAIVSSLLKFESKWFDHDVSPSPLIDSKDMLQLSLDINETAQAISYSNDREDSLNLLLHPSTIFDTDLIANVNKAILESKARLTVIKIKRLDLRRDVDFDAMDNLKSIFETVSEARVKNKSRVFAFWEAGNQFFVALPAFDMVSRAFGIIEGDVGFGKYSKRGTWWDGVKMWPRKEKQATRWFRQDLSISQAHCPICTTIPDLDLLSDRDYRRKRRQCFLFDMNSKAQIIREAIKQGKTEIRLRQMLAYSTLASLQDLILNGKSYRVP